MIGAYICVAALAIVCGWALVRCVHALAVALLCLDVERRKR